MCNLAIYQNISFFTFLRMFNNVKFKTSSSILTILLLLTEVSLAIQENDSTNFRKGKGKIAILRHQQN